MMIPIKQLETLDCHKQLIFAYLTCERLYPNYVYFSENFNFGNADILRGAIDYLYENLFALQINKPLAEKWIKSIEDVIPETAEFDTILASSAMDACNTIIETLNFLFNKNVSRLYDISTFATDTVDMYIQELENLDFNNDNNFQLKIDNHPLMQKEVSIQTGILTYLINSKNIDLNDVLILIKLQANNQKGSLNL